ncbi:metallopeptidase [Synechococcus sp. RS9915]|nr:metallopeptidase [Synechococcus sp. RS9915]
MINLKEEWSLQFGGSGDEGPRDVIVDQNGDIYVIGGTGSYVFDGNNQNVPGVPSVENPDGFDTAFLSKISSEGIVQWTQFIINGTNFNNAYGVALSNDDFLYVTGEGYNDNDDLQENFLAKISIDGAFKWREGIAYPGRDVKVDSTNSVIVLTEYQPTLRKFSSEGDEQWSVSLNDGNQEGEIAIGSDDSIFIAGQLDESQDAILIKYSPDGTKVWERIFGGADDDKAHGVIQSSDGSIYVTGATRSSVFDDQYNSVLEKDHEGLGVWECFLVKFTSEGEKQWTRLFGGTDREKAYDLAEGVDGSIFVVGETSSPDFAGAGNAIGHKGAFLVNYSPDGSHQWSSYIIEDGDSESLSISCDGALVISGDAGENAKGDDDIVLEKYAPLIDIYQIPEVDCIASFTLSSIYKLQESEVKDLIVGTNEKDLIIGTAENEILVGRGSKDKISGGKGADGFLFDKFNEFSKKGMNIVEDFDNKEGDAILLARTDFGLRKKIKLKVVSGKKSASKASTKKSNIVYDEKKGLLYFNENGKEEGWGDGGLFAKLQGAPELGADDFTIV